MQSLKADHISKLGEFIASSKQIAVITHNHPDGDAIGSSTAMTTYINSISAHKAKTILPNDYAENLEFVIVPESTIVASQNIAQAQQWIDNSDLLIILDLNKLSRSETLEPIIRNSFAKRILIDHHQNPEIEDFDLVFSDTEVSSTCELLFFVLRSLIGKTPELAVATPLFLGMTTDTNNFANSTSPSTLAMASELIGIGVDRDRILSELYNCFRENRFRAMGAFLSEKMTILPFGVAYVIFDKKTMQKFGLKEGETESFVNLPLGIKSVNYSIFLKEDEGYFRVSIRSKKGYSAARLSQQFFNGGGHENAAGGRLFFPKDIAKPEMAAQYIEINSARFVQQENTDNE